MTSRLNSPRNNPCKESSGKQSSSKLPCCFLYNCCISETRGIYLSERGDPSIGWDEKMWEGYQTCLLQGSESKPDRLDIWSSFLTFFLHILSIHRRQNECKHGSVLGSLTVSRHSGHSASFLRFVNSCWTSMSSWKSWELAECGWHVTSLIMHKTRPRGGISLLMSLHPLRPIQIYMCSLLSLSMNYSFCF